jgi:hypothetical protein
MRLIWVKVGGLWPVNTGGRIRSFHMLRELSRRHEVTLLTTHAPSESPRELEAAPPRCEVVSVPWALAKREARFALALVRSWLCRCRSISRRGSGARPRGRARRPTRGGVDLVVADFCWLRPTWAAPRRRRCCSPTTSSVIWQRMREVERRGWRRAAGAREPQMRRYEARACERARLTIGVGRRPPTPRRRGAGRLRVPCRPGSTWTTSPGRRRGDSGAARLHRVDGLVPNEDGIVHFIEDVLPRVRARYRRRP